MNMIKDAILSKDGIYRYNLIREWDPMGPVMLFVMLNPSTADAVDDDPTIRRCIDFAQREECGMIEVVNLFAFRATDPDELKTTSHSIIGEDNDDIITMAAEEANVIVCAWGTKGVLQKRNKVVVSMLREVGKPVMCLGKTKDGHPKHPLYLAKETPLIEM